MSIVLVTYDLKASGRDYSRVYDYLKSYTYCKGMESVWLIETAKSASTIRDEMMSRVDSNDVVFTVKITREWASYNYYCSELLNKPERIF